MGYKKKSRLDAKYIIHQYISITIDEQISSFMLPVNIKIVVISIAISLSLARCFEGWFDSLTMFNGGRILM